MKKQPGESLDAFLQRQDASTLASVLLELAAEHEPVQQRLDRMKLADRPDKLAAGFRKTLAAWRRSTRFHGYREAREYGRQLEAWLGQVERELLPKDPSAAHTLFESFIEADATWFERADDSDGCIGDAIGAACPCVVADDVERSAARRWQSRGFEIALFNQKGCRPSPQRWKRTRSREPCRRSGRLYATHRRRPPQRRVA